MADVLSYPTKDCIFTACDSVYYDNFAPTLIESAKEHGVHVHVHFMGTRAELDRSQVTRIALERENFSVSLCDVPNPETAPQRRVFYACGRIIGASEAAAVFSHLGVEANPSYFLLDVDSIVRGQLTFPGADLCYYKTDPATSGAQNDIEREGMHLLASAFVRPTQIANYLHRVAHECHISQYAYWFLDQVQMYRHLDLVPEDKISLMNDLNILDIEFVGGTAIWTGRGPRKYTEAKYMTTAARYRDKFFGRV
jgi:hypothetical protein